MISIFHALSNCIPQSYKIVKQKKILKFIVFQCMVLSSQCLFSQTIENNKNDTNMLIIRSGLQDQLTEIKSFSDLLSSEYVEITGTDEIFIGQKDFESGINKSGTVSLQSLLTNGFIYNPVISQAKSGYEIAEAQKQVSRAELFPSLSAKHSFGPETSEGGSLGVGVTNNHNYQMSSFRLTQPIFNVPIMKDYMSTSKYQDASEFKLRETEQSIALDIVRATTELAASRLVLNFSDDLLNKLGSIFSYLETRAEAGATSQSDLERARTRLLSARQLRIEQQTTYRNAILELARLTGVVPKKLKLPSIQKYPQLPDTLDLIQKTVIEQDYGLRALKMEIESQKDAVHREIAKLLPVVGLSLEHDESTNIRNTLPTQTDSRVLLVMAWTGSVGGKEIYASNQSKSELRRLESKYQEESQRTSRAVDSEFALMTSAKQRLQVAQNEENAATKVVKAVTEQLKNGKMSGTLLEALDACDRLFLAKQHQIQALSQQMIAHAQLLRSIGILSELQAVNE